MNIENLENIIEAILFVSGKEVAIESIMEALGVQKSEIKKAVDGLNKRYTTKGGIKVITFENKLQLGSNPLYAEAVARVLNPIVEKELTTSALETIAIIAYRQPITRLEIEQIRGVNCDYAVSVLQRHRLIDIVGYKDAIGKPAQFGTTPTFLKRFQISSIKDLPDYTTLIDKMKELDEKRKEMLESTQSMYDEFEIAHKEVATTAEEEIPEFLEGEKIEIIK